MGIRSVPDAHASCLAISQGSVVVERTVHDVRESGGNPMTPAGVMLQWNTDRPSG